MSGTAASICRHPGDENKDSQVALHTHNETGRDAIQLLVTRTDTTTYGRIWPGCIQIRFRVTHTNLASGRKPNKKPTQEQDDTSARIMKDGARGQDHEQRPEHAAMTTAGARGTSTSTIGVAGRAVGHGPWSTSTTCATAPSTLPRRAPPTENASHGATGGIRSHYLAIIPTTGAPIVQFDIKERRSAKQGVA
jgi:hypothetical protein